MPLSVARRLLPPNAIIGVSCTTPEQVRKAVEGGADYVGLGAVYVTSTKDVSAPGSVCGIAGARAMLSVLEGTGVKAIAIGSYLFLLLPFTQWVSSKGVVLMRVAQAVLNRRTCSARCTAVRLPLATLFMVLLSCQTLWPRLTLARLPHASHKHSVPGRQLPPPGLLASKSCAKRFSIRPKESQPWPQPSFISCGNRGHLFIRYPS